MKIIASIDRNLIDHFPNWLVQREKHWGIINCARILSDCQYVFKTFNLSMFVICNLLLSIFEYLNRELDPSIMHTILPNK